MDIEIRPIGRETLCARQEIETARDILQTWLDGHPPHPEDIEHFRQVVGRIDARLDTDGGQHGTE